MLSKESCGGDEVSYVEDKETDGTRKESFVKRRESSFKDKKSPLGGKEDPRNNVIIPYRYKRL